MRRKLIIYTALSLFISLLSCQNKSRPTSVKMSENNEFSDTSCIVFKIKTFKDLDDLSNLDDLDVIVDKIEYIPLETNSSSLIGSINMMKFYKGKFYILDSRLAKAVLIFNEDGTHFKTIKNVGNGPAEYISPQYISIDSFNDELILCDRNDNGILYYDLDGNFKREENAGFRFSNIERITKEDFLIFLGAAWNTHKPEIDNYTDRKSVV